MLNHRTVILQAMSEARLSMREVPPTRERKRDPRLLGQAPGGFLAAEIIGKPSRVHKVTLRGVSRPDQAELSEAAGLAIGTIAHIVLRGQGDPHILIPTMMMALADPQYQTKDDDGHIIGRVDQVIPDVARLTAIWSFGWLTFIIESLGDGHALSA